MRIAHVSDLHLLSLDGARLSQFMNKRWMGGVNLALNRGRHYRSEVFSALVDDINDSNVDHVVCTGDITNLSFATEFEFARGFFARFSLGPKHVTCVPGNHDSYVAEGEGLFERTFNEYCTSDDDTVFGVGAGTDRWPIVRLRGDVAIIGVSTSRPSGWFTSHGELGDAQLRRLDAALADARVKSRFRLLLIHHPPAGRCSEKPLRGLRDRSAFAEVIARHGVDLILHGHEHLDLHASLYGPRHEVIPVRGIQSATYDAPVPRRLARYRIYEVGQAGGAQHPRLITETLKVWTGHGFAGDLARAA